MNSTSGRTFIDTNVLIYAHDVDAQAKRRGAKEILRELWSERSGVLSVQVLQEFYVNVTRKISPPPLERFGPAGGEQLHNLVHGNHSRRISTAFRIEDESRIGFWDALIVSSAAKSGATRILSEDLGAGQRIAGIPIENPFDGIQ